MAKVRTTDNGVAYCDKCHAILLCNEETGDMPERCPHCSEGLDYSTLKAKTVVPVETRGNSDRFYSLHTHDGGIGVETLFDTIEELRDKAMEYLTQAEIREGVLRYLTTFDEAKIKDGILEKRWRSISTYIYLL